MAQYYPTVSAYVWTARNQLQDLVGPPYRYADDQIVDALNHALNEMGRIRPDIFLDLKYQNRLIKGDIGEGLPGPYTIADIAVGDDGSYDITEGTQVPVPSKYVSPVNWYVAGWLQLYDVADTTDARAQAMLAKFQQQLMSLTAA